MTEQKATPPPHPTTRRGSSAHSTPTSTRSRHRIGLVALLLVAALSLGGTCSKSPKVTITSPANGEFIDAASVLVMGVVEDVADEKLVDVTVNGTSVLPLAGDGSFAVVVPLDALDPLNALVAAVTTSDGGPTLRDRVTVVVGDAVTDTDFNVDSVALRLTEAGLDAIEPTVTSLVDIDLGGFAIRGPGNCTGQTGALIQCTGNAGIGIDVAIGTAAVAANAARIVGPTGRVFGADGSDPGASASASGSS